MSEQADGMRIDVKKDGPYLVSGGVPLSRDEIVTNEAGESVAWRETERLETRERYLLCRCGRSKTKPFCDGTHAIGGIDGTEMAIHDSYLEQSVCIDGPALKLRDARKLCAEARFCDREGGLWNLILLGDDPDTYGLVVEEASLCPSGRYTACEPDTEDPIEPALPPSIAVIEDPHEGVSGPLWVRGGIPVVSAEGEPYEVRNRVTLCRCGRSANKPFCDGEHLRSGFTEVD
jgi:CDGSH-type Zn-finger protein